MKRSHSSIADEELFHAVSRGRLWDVQILVNRGVDIHAKFDQDIHSHSDLDINICGTVMHVAAFYGHRHLLAYFVNKGLNVNAIDDDGHGTPLHRASEAGHAKVVRFLLDQNANMHAVNFLGQKPIHVAAEAEQKDVVQIFLNMGMDVQDADWSGSTLLHISCFAKNLNLVKFLMNYNADIHAKNAAGQKAIHIAAALGLKDIVRVFLRRGMSVNETDENGHTLLHLACRFSGLKFVQFLVVNNADIHAKTIYGNTPIHVAASFGCNDVVKYFLHLGMSIDETNESGQTPLHLAAKMRQLEVVQLLVDAKPQLDVQDNQGQTPMHMCNFQPDVLNCLLDAGARSDIKDNVGRTVLYYFIHNGIGSHFNCQSLLTKMHHNFIDIDNSTKMTAAHLIAEKFDNMDLIQRVLQCQKDLNTKNKYGETPMNYLMKNLFFSPIDQQETLIRMFVDHGACFTVEDCEQIVRRRSLKERLFTDKKFCFQYVVNKFGNVDLPMLARLPSAISMSVLEKLKLKSSQICLIESAVEEEIRNKGHCDVSKMVPPLLSILAIESYISHYQA